MFINEYQAARTGAALYDLSDQGKIYITGKDRINFLHRLLTNDILACTPGRGCHAALLTSQGHVISCLRLSAVDHAILLDTPPSTRTTVYNNLNEFLFREDVQIEDQSDPKTLLGVHGPNASTLLSTTLAIKPEVLEELPVLHNMSCFIEDSPVLLIRDRYFGESGWDIFGSRSVINHLREKLIKAGATLISAQTARVLLMETGIPAYPEDFDESVTLFEAGLENCSISFTKGCYPGQEVMTWIRERNSNRTSRKLVGLTIDGSTVPATHDALIHNGLRAGHITSGVFSETLQRPIAFGYIRWDLKVAGTDIHVQHEKELIKATVCALPFVRHDKPQQ